MTVKGVAFVLVPYKRFVQFIVCNERETGSARQLGQGQKVGRSVDGFAKKSPLARLSRTKSSINPSPRS